MIPVKGIGPRSGFVNRPDPERVRKALEMAIRAGEERKHPGFTVKTAVELITSTTSERATVGRG